ncbi:alpha/beta hydrolase [Microbacterium paludicola]|uniref:Alpha/beta hydrolase n=1 Tax=Microbacterium paludicola TaxID=300019 RepID=A0A4Y9FXV5_9MICO|nr:alpha/beta hydrolase [Microbacterium paludicola]MBF0815016.1 alpha/beta fold hydrolase [Microbacterium paludicola]TFU34296.1 alpha/beta hydrolase [Microbacterium paludicola]
MTSHIRRLLAAVAILLTGALALSGCLYAQIPPTEEGGPCVTQPEVGADVSSELRPFYEQELDWADCGNGMETATVTAPLDWNDPSAGEIELELVRQPATGGDSLGSLLINPGGPGASGYDFVAESVDFAVSEQLQERYDIIGFDPRGVGRSTPVKCLDTAGMDDFLYDLPQHPRGTPEWEAELVAENQGFADACEQNSGGILEFITTDQAARDMDLIRGVLGDEKLTYLGYSYGTFLGATYAKLFPDRVGRLVLDGAIDPSVSGTDVGITQGIGFERALRTYMQSCLDGEGCPFDGTVDQAMGDLSALLAAVDRSPLPAPDDRQLGADTLVTAIVAALYAPENWTYLTQALSEALQGDPTTAFMLADFYNGRENGEYADNSSEAFQAYNCMDYPVAQSQEAEDAASALLEKEAPTIAPYWEGPGVCEVWPHEPTGVREKIAASGAAPIVVIGTTGDPATPYDWAVSLADQLSSGVLVTYEGEGHTAYNGQSDCVDQAVDAYFLEGTVPQDGLRCAP